MITQNANNLQPASVVLQFHWDRAEPAHLHIPQGCSGSTKVVSSSWDRDHMACKVLNKYYLSFKEKAYKLLIYRTSKEIYDLSKKRYVSVTAIKNDFTRHLKGTCQLLKFKSSQYTICINCIQREL